MKWHIYKVGEAIYIDMEKVEAALSKVVAYRRAAMKALGGLGEHAAPHASSMASLLGDEDEDVRSSAAWALGQLGPAAAPHGPERRGRPRSALRTQPSSITSISVSRGVSSRGARLAER